MSTNLYMSKEHQKALLNTLLCELIDCESLDVFIALSAVSLLHLDNDCRILWSKNHNVKRFTKLLTEAEQND